MTATDYLNIAGFVIAAAGSTVGMIGTFKQMNAYYPFKVRKFLDHLFRVTRKALSEGGPAAIQQVEATAKLGQRRGEDRASSLIGLYCVFCGFFLQVLGAFLLLLASLFSTSRVIRP
jgi:hypothetical protein